MSTEPMFDLSDGAAASRTTPTVASPIADLSYRGYDGPLLRRTVRWWVVAHAGIRPLGRKGWFWAWAIIALLPFLWQGFQLYMLSLQKAAAQLNPFLGDAGHEKYAVAFFQAYSSQIFWLFLVALVVGAASISADNRANALQVYLSRPITRVDYLLGKWIGVAVPIYLVAAVPALLMYVYCLLSFSGQGFWSQDRWLIVRVLGVAAVPAVIQASVLLGISAWSKTPRMAGVFYAAVYFVSSAVANLFWLIRFHGHVGKGVLEQHLSLEGVMTGLGQQIYHVTLRTQTFQRFGGHSVPRDVSAIGFPREIAFYPPVLWDMLALAAGLVIVGLIAARVRIRAVEVVRG